jgi:integrase
LNRGPERPRLSRIDLECQRSPNLSVFKDFCIVDLQLRESTAKVHTRLIKKFLKTIRKAPNTVTKEDLRQYLKIIKTNMAPYTYKNHLSALKRFYRDFLGMDYLVNTFKYPSISFKPKKVPPKAELQEFYKELQTPRARALFLLYATSGLRNSEILNLHRFQDIDYENRMLTPNKEGNQSKHTWISFYNVEAEKELKAYLVSRKDSDLRLFPISKRHVLRIFKRASETTGTKVTPQTLRDWFCCEMGSLGVPDRYVDAFCGRVPKSVLARHYTDFSPKKLKIVYDNAGLKIL